MVPLEIYCVLYTYPDMSKARTEIGSRKSNIPMYSDSKPLPKQALIFTCQLYKSFENTVGKEEIARHEQFLLFQQCFSILSESFPPFSSNLKLSPANFFGLEESKIYRLGKG